MVRFKIKTKELPDGKFVSIFLDCYDLFGCMGETFWEVYPYKGDIFRCGLYEIDELLMAIKESLKQLGGA